MLTKDRADFLLGELRREVVPALGCTEPIALALCVAVAVKEHKRLPEKIDIKVSLNVYKNGMGVGIPGTDKVGLYMAAALGALVGDASLELEVLSKVTPKDVQKAEEYLKEGRINIGIATDCDKLYVEAICIGDYAKAGLTQDYVKAIIETSHANVVCVENCGKKVFEKERLKPSLDGSFAKTSEHGTTIDEIYEFATTWNLEDLEFIMEAAEMNTALSNYGLENRCGMAVGANMLDWVKKSGGENSSSDLINYAVALTAAASDARMSGALLPAMSNSGSGNQGITAMMPVVAVHKKLGLDREALVRALILSNLTAIHMKYGFGRLSAACGCVVASTGAATGVCYLLGGDKQKVAASIKNMIGNLAGMICDGAKLGCALKVASGTSAAMQAAILSQNNVCVPEDNGIVEKDIERCIQNICTIANTAMNEADNVILDIMTHKQN